MPGLGSHPSYSCLGQFLIHFLICFCTLQYCCFLILENIFLIFMCLAILLSPSFACSAAAKVQSVPLVLAANQTWEGCMILAFLGLKWEDLMYKFPSMVFSKNLCTKVWQQCLPEMPAPRIFGKEKICVSSRHCSNTVLSQEQELNNGEACWKQP